MQVFEQVGDSGVPIVKVTFGVEHLIGGGGTVFQVVLTFDERLIPGHVQKAVKVRVYIKEPDVGSLYRCSREVIEGTNSNELKGAVVDQG